ncbi:MAG TPA: outer membrane beta-barrel protein [Steroidobacteraceae bacterium]|nr:outer membrane beta-barrel protein [Steroidobacteraceae bacterium]
MGRTNYRTTWLGIWALAALAIGRAEAGDFQLAMRLGEDWIDIDGDRLSSGNGVNDHLLNLGLTASYRWPRGGYLELGLAGSGSIDIFGIQSVDHHWIGGGWQFDAFEKVKVTPKAGFTYSELTSSEEDLFDSEPVDRFSDVAPFVELTVERRLLEHMGLGLYFRHTFEDWGSTRDFGLTFSWTFQ